jgi:GNAT superfamily N-acetyltransferase
MDRAQIDRAQMDRAQMDRAQMDRAQMDRAQMDRAQMDRAQMDRAPGPVGAEIRRARSSDLAALRDFFAGLSQDSRYLRFFAPVKPTPAMLRRLSGGTGAADCVVATAGGVIIGHAMAADQAGPRGAMTDIGVVVADAWQGRGVGSALVRALITRARARGVTSLTMDVLPGNRRVLAMIAGHWTAARTDPSADGVTIHVRLPRRQRRRLRRLPGRRAPSSALDISRRPGVRMEAGA